MTDEDFRVTVQPIQHDNGKWGAPVLKSWHGDPMQITGYRGQKILVTVMFTVMLTAALLILMMG